LLTPVDIIINRTPCNVCQRYVGRQSKEKQYGEMTLPVYEFMTRMLYYLPEKNSKEIRWYGMDANGVREKLKEMQRKTWAMAIKNSFGKNPELCPHCKTEMLRSVTFSFFAVREAKHLWRTMPVSEDILSRTKTIHK
jgi:hypothetical protein